MPQNGRHVYNNIVILMRPLLMLPYLHCDDSDVTSLVSTTNLIMGPFESISLHDNRLGLFFLRATGLMSNLSPI